MADEAPVPTEEPTTNDQPASAEGSGEAQQPTAEIPVPEPVAEPVPEPVPAPESIPEPTPGVISAPETVTPNQSFGSTQDDTGQAITEVMNESPLKPLNRETAKELSIKAHRAKLEIRSSKLERIIKEVNIKGTINNDKVQLLLGVSDATAARYLKILAGEGRIVREGKGRFLRYRKN